LRKPAKIHGLTEEKLMDLDPVVLRAILHERTHHTIEVNIYRIMAGKKGISKSFGETAGRLIDIWKARGLPTDAPDIQWCLNYVGFARMLRTGGDLDLGLELAKPFTKGEMETVEKLIYGRKSIRQFRDQPVTDEMIDRILHAGLYAPHSCNMGSTRYLVLREPEEWKLVRSDIPLENCVMIVVLQDLRMYKALNFDELVPQNLYYDAAATADHICLMAHALGLGGCWLTHGEDTQRRLRDYFGLHKEIVSRNHIVVGWPDESPIKSQRMKLEETVLNR
jgi:nitroreductase|tara:strand:- start:4861 stop:5697 length:837 start_codon:yes stop_codon:yes gene_type:complete